MDKKLRILFLEDVPADAELLERELRKGGIRFTSKRVETKEAFLIGLKEFEPDLILGDYKLPSFDGLSALGIVQEKCPDVPFIFISGTIGEELATETLKSGATDYVLKDRLSRLVPAVNRALREVEERTKRKQADEALRRSEERFRLLAESSITGIYLFQEGRFLYVNKALASIFGYQVEEIVGRLGPLDLTHPDDRPAVAENIRRRLWGEVETIRSDFRGLRKDGTEIFVEVHGTRIEYGGKVGIIGTLVDVTERKRAEGALKEKEDFLNNIIEQTPNPIWISDKQGAIIRINQALRDLLKIADEEIIGKYNVLNDVQVKEQGLLPLIKTVFEKGETVNFTIDYHTEKEKQLELAQKSHKVLDIIIAPIKNKEGEIAHAICQHKDITERKQVETALRESEERYRRLVDNSLLGIGVSCEGRVVFANSALLRLFGYDDPEEFTKIPLLDHIAPASRELIAARMEKVIQGKPVPAEFEYDILRKDGLTKTLLASSQHFTLGGKTYSQTTFQDITERKRAEEALQESEERFRLAFENANTGMCLVDLDGNLTRVNKRMCEIFGYTKEELEHMTVNDIALPEDMDKSPEFIQKTLQGEIDRGTFEKRYFHKQGHVVTCQVSGSLVRDAEGTPLYFVSHVHDITEGKRAEGALRESEERYRTLVETSPDAIALVDLNLNVLMVNRPALALYGYKSPEEVLGRSVLSFIAPPDRTRALQEVQQVLEKGSLENSEYTQLKKGDVPFPAELSASVILDERKKPLAIICVTRDISIRKRGEEERATLEDQLRQSQKMEAIGQLAGGVAHDFNNLLTVIKGYCQLSLAETKEGTPSRDAVEVISKAAEKAADLTRQLLAFSRRQIMEAKVLDLNELLQNLEKMLRRIISEDIELVTSLGEDLGRVKADPGQIEQVVMNLAVNAKDAMSGGGKLIIETANVELDESYARAHVSVTPGRYVMIAVSDTGTGMAPEVRDRVFEPFFTTKGKGKGTGLGLSTVYGIVKQSNGNIWVYSEPGKGTTFKIFLPCVDEPVEKQKAQGAEEEFPRGSETILIVEDDKEVRNLTVRILERQGYAVLDGSYGDEAFQVCRQHRGPIHLLVTDVVMPGMDGRTLSECLSQLHPEMRVLYMSGYTDDAIIHHGVLAKGMNYIQKPFTVDALARKVREVLDRSRQN